MTLSDADARAAIRRAHSDRAFRERVIAHCREDSMPKRTHAAVHYRKGTQDRKCGLCTMFRSPNTCTAVKTPIAANDLCDLFVRKRPVTVMGKPLMRPVP